MRIEETRSSEPGRPRIWIGLRLNKPEEGVMSNLSNMSTQKPLLCEIQQKTTKIGNTVDTLDTLDKNKIISRLLCGTCFKTKSYETMTGVERKGIVSEGICADCGRPAELLIHLKETSST
jgi:hypothetical protein